ncbi:MAG: hypothetical protein K2X28_08190 [Alphaproteobacteria bacterium]|nr:hypothetical protein [Alphaproteobacteria bacterium]
MLKKIIFCAFLLSYTSSVHGMEENPMDAGSQYLTIIQKAHEGVPNSINGLHAALRELKRSFPPYSYSKKLSELYEQALDEGISPKKFAESVKGFIRGDYRRIGPSPRFTPDDSFYNN